MRAALEGRKKSSHIEKSSGVVEYRSGTPGRTPSPRNESDASETIMPENSKVAMTITGGKTFGSA
jgi:hypothetical protein